MQACVASLSVAGEDAESSGNTLRLVADETQQEQNDAGCEPVDMQYLGRVNLDCETCDELASSINPLYRRPIASDLRLRKFRPWFRYRGGMPEGRQCYICVKAARRGFKSKGGITHLQHVKKRTRP